VTITISGIAGFILSLGMAVDANVLIFERLKEELRAGRGLSSAIEEGFRRAWTSIRDSNVSSLITSGILYWFGTSIVKGFALTLGLGVMVSLFSSFVVTRTFLTALAIKGENKIAVAFFGDGAVEEGIFWESINFVSVHKLPVIFVCENNFYATHSPILRRQPHDEIVSRVIPHGLTTVTTDGNNVLDVLYSAKVAIRLAKTNHPVFIEARTYRFKEHWGVGDDWHLGYRSREEGEKWLKRCPLQNLYDDLKQRFESNNYWTLDLRICQLEKMVKTKNEHVFPKDGGWVVRHEGIKKTFRFFENKILFRTKLLFLFFQTHGLLESGMPFEILILFDLKLFLNFCVFFLLL